MENLEERVDNIEIMPPSSSRVLKKGIKQPVVWLGYGLVAIQSISTGLIYYYGGVKPAIMASTITASSALLAFLNNYWIGNRILDKKSASKANDY